MILLLVFASLPLSIFCRRPYPPPLPSCTDGSMTSDEITAYFRSALSDGQTSACACSAGMPLSTIQHFWDVLDYTSTDPCLYCFWRCVYTTLGFIDEQGNIVKDVYLSKVLGVTEELVDHCISNTQDIIDPCLKVFNFGVCMATDCVQ